MIAVRRAVTSAASHVRQAVRRVAGVAVPRPLRDRAFHALNTISAVRCLGIAGARRLHAAEADPHPSTVSAFSVRTLQHPVWIRHGTTDANELVHTVCRRTYAQWLPAETPRWILDLGANMGDTAVWYLSTFPSAQVVAVEPDPANFEIARKNLAPYGSRAIAVQAAVWPADGPLRLQVNAAHRSGSRLEPEGDPERVITCEGISIPTLLARFAIPSIDILKCDIESTEKALFREQPDEWLAKTRHMCVELHDGEAVEIVYRAARRHGFRGRRYRDIHVFTRRLI